MSEIDKETKRNVRRTTILLVLLVAGFYGAFIIAQAMRAAS